MPRLPNIFIDPRTNVQYQWPINHTSEDTTGKSRQISDGAPTSNVGLIPQQGASTPLKLTWKGTMFDILQVVATTGWWNLCETQTIYLQDFSGASYEVIIEDFHTLRKSVVRNPRMPGQAWQWEYTIVIRVLKIFAGEWFLVKP